MLTPVVLGGSLGYLSVRDIRGGSSDLCLSLLLPGEMESLVLETHGGASGQGVAVEIEGQNFYQFAVVALGLTISQTDPYHETADMKYWHFRANDLPPFSRILK